VRSVVVTLERDAVSTEDLLLRLSPLVTASASCRANGQVALRIADRTSMAAALRAARGCDGVRSAEPAEPRMTRFDKSSSSAMRRTLAAWKAAWKEYYALVPATAGSPPYHQKKKIPKLGYYESYLEWYDARAYPDDEINWAIYARGRSAQDDLLAPPGSIKTKWVYLGPTNLDTPFNNGMGLPPVNGRVNAMAYDPQDPDTIFAASACGGVWKTTTGGTSWFPFADDWEELYTSSIAVDPQDPDTLYVGTGDFPGYRGTGIGLMKSTDGGYTWQDLGGALLENIRISDVVIDPVDSRRVTISSGRPPAGAGTRIYQTTDGGTTWDTVLLVSADWCDLSIGQPRAIGPERYYVAGVVTDSDNNPVSNELRRSDDRGETWSALPLPSIAPQRALGVDASQLDPETVYLYAPSDREVYRSTNAGQTWTNITGNLNQDNINWYQDFYSFRISCGIAYAGDGDPFDEIWIANNDVMRGTAGGAWEILGGPAYSDDGLLHVDTHGFAQHPTDINETLVCNDGGVYRHDGTDFHYLSGRLGCMLPNRLDVHPTSLNFLLGGTQDNGTSLCTGNLSQWYTIVPGDTGHVAVNQTFPQLQYAAPASQLGRDDNDDVYIWRTDDFWDVGSGSQLTTNVGSDLMRHGTPIAIDPVNTNRLYFASNYLYRYDEITQQWSQQLGNQKLSTAKYVFTMAIAPSDGNRIYTGSTDREIWMTTNAGASWTRIDDLVTPNYTVAAFSVDPNNPSRILVGYSSSSQSYDKLWECPNTLANPRIWQTPVGVNIGEMLPNVPINAIARHLGEGQTHWYVGTDIGVFGTVNAGNKWFDMTRPLGLPRVEVTDLKVNKLKYLYASTYGRGFWRIKALPHTAPAILIAP